MRIKNETQYSTRQIRKVLTKVHNHMAKAEGRMPRWPDFFVRIGRTRTPGVTGYAYLGNANRGPTYSRKVYFSGGARRLTDWSPVADVVLRLFEAGETERTLGSLAYHEFMHSYGYRHKQYSEIPESELEALFPENRALS